MDGDCLEELVGLAFYAQGVRRPRLAKVTTLPFAERDNEYTGCRTYYQWKILIVENALEHRPISSPAHSSSANSRFVLSPFGVLPFSVPV